MSAFPKTLMVASGCGGTGRELAAYVPGGADGLAGLGFVTRTLTLDPRAGGRQRIAEAPAGLVRAHRLQNTGVDRFLMTELPWLAQHGLRTWVSITGATLAECLDAVRRLAPAPGLSGVELNLAVDDPRAEGVYDATEPFQAARLVQAVREELQGLALHVKLPGDPRRVVAAAKAVGDAGADAVVVGGALPAALANGTQAELSGPAVAPVALRCVADVAAALPDLTVIGVGGIMGADDVRAHLDAGATAVQLGTALLHDPTSLARISADLSDEGDDQ